MTYSKYICDCETTGVNPELHDVIEVCFWRLGDEESKTWWLKPLHPENIQEEALKINGHKREDILHRTEEGRAKYRNPSEVLAEIEMWFMTDSSAAEDRVFIGQNPMFDYNFLLKLWSVSGNSDNFPFGYWIEDKDGKRNQGMVIDTIQLARVIDICTDQRRDRYNLGSLVKNFSITKATAHRADGDVKMTKDLFLKMIDPIKNVLNDEFKDTYSK
jgi:DNA polymerase III alpha subunit (gram-positive type)